MAHPEGETKKERRLQRVVGTGVIVVFLLLVVIVLQGIVAYRSQTNHHASSTAQQQEILNGQKQGHKTLDQIKALQVQVALQQKEVTTVIAGLPAADAKLTTFAGQITQVDNWIVGCLATGNCANPPKF